MLPLRMCILMMSASRSDDAYRKDYKYLLLDKENVPVKRDTKVLVMTEDSGKTFSSTGAGDRTPHYQQSVSQAPTG